MYSLSNAGPDGTHLQSEIDVAPADLIAAFGPPQEGDEYKTSGEYVFEHDEFGDVFTLYDYKATSLYDEREETPEEFWSSTRPREIHVGGHGDATDFIKWVYQKIKEAKQ